MISNKVLISILASLFLTNARVIDSQLPVSQDGRCGKGIAVCREGFCCSKLGWCGNSDLHCKVEEGCQSDFGICNEPEGESDEEPTDVYGKDKDVEFTTETVCEDDTDSESEIDIIYGKCGVGYGSCPDGYCCSKFGWCGRSELYCDISLGCQTEFGICDNPRGGDVTEDSTTEDLPVSVDGRCGEGIAVCGEGFCCSKYGWCGQADLYCNIEEGCQSNYGTCNPFDIEKPKEETPVPKGDDELPVTQDGRCGEGVAVCREGDCCSSHGWCGKSDDHCKVEKGCQSEFGKCTPSVPVEEEINPTEDVDVPSDEEEVPIKKDDDVPSDEEQQPIKKDDDVPSDEEQQPIKKDDDVPSDEEQQPIKKDDDVPSDEEQQPIKKDDDVPSDDEQPARDIETSEQPTSTETEVVASTSLIFNPTPKPEVEDEPIKEDSEPEDSEPEDVSPNSTQTITVVETVTSTYEELVTDYLEEVDN